MELIVIAVAVGLVVGRSAVQAFVARDRFWGAVSGVAFCAPIMLMGVEPTAATVYVVTALGTMALLVVLPERGADSPAAAPDVDAVGGPTTAPSR